MLWGSMIVGAILFLLSFGIGKSYLPLAYFVRLVLLLIAAAVAMALDALVTDVVVAKVELSSVASAPEMA